MIRGNVPPTARDPRDRQAAIFSISQALRELNLEGWSWTIIDWLRLYDGIEPYLPPEDDPVVVTANVFASVARRRPLTDVIASDVVKLLEQQPFLCWHVQWVDAEGVRVGDPWRPLDAEPATFWDYAASAPSGAVQLAFEHTSQMHVTADQLRNWLVAGYLRFAITRHDIGH